MLTNRDSIYDIRHTDNGKKIQLISPHKDFKFIKRASDDKAKYPSYPWDFGMFNNDQGFGIASFYNQY